MRIEHIKGIKRAVIKIGTSVLSKDHKPDAEFMQELAAQVRLLLDQKIHVSIVSSGAIGSGMMRMGLKQRPSEMKQLQACAAVGQRYLMECYEKAFASLGFSTAQILLTWDDLSEQTRCENARKTIDQLLEWNLIPIINENDTVATDEIKFGDNDNLSALIAILMEADLLIILSDTDGLYKIDESGRLIERISVVDKITPEITSHVRDSQKSYSVGGMLSKLNAVQLAVDAGIATVLAGGRREKVLEKLFSGEDEGTFFLPKKSAVSSSVSWQNYFAKLIEQRKLQRKAHE